MPHLLEFVTNHALLFAAFAGLLVALVWSFVSEWFGPAQVSGAEATLLINREDAVVLDVRGAAEFDAGHITGAVNAPFTALQGQASDLARYRERKVVICCAQGMQARSAAALLKQAGFAQLFLLRGGIAQWRADNLPLTSGRR